VPSARAEGARRGTQRPVSEQVEIDELDAEIRIGEHDAGLGDPRWNRVAEAELPEIVVHARVRRAAEHGMPAIALASSLGACNAAKDPTEAANKRREINAGVDAALKKLYSSTPGAQEQGNRAKGILVFPSVIASGLVIGGEYGEGALREGGSSVGYYMTSTASFDLQIGAQSKAVFLMFMTQDALDKFRTNDKGWTAGRTFQSRFHSALTARPFSPRLARRPAMAIV
jgi:hypothetical protein